MMEYVINAIAYIVVLWVFVFMVNPFLFEMFSDDKFSKYKDAVMVPLLIESLLAVFFCCLLLVIASFDHVLDGGGLWTYKH